MADGGNMSIGDLIAAIKKMDKSDQNKIKKEIGDKNSSLDTSKYNKDQLKFLARQNEMLAETAELLGDTVTAAEQRVKQSERAIKALETELNLSESQRAAISDVMDQYEKFGQVEDETLSKLEDIDKELLNQLDLYKERIDLEKGLNAIRKDGIPLVDSMAKSLGLQAKYANSAFGQTASLVKKISEGGIEGERALKAMSKYLLDTFSLENIALNVFNAIKDNSIELFNNFDKAQASLAAATGQGQEFNDVLYEVGRSTNLYGVSMDEAGKAIGVLVNQTSYFTSLNKATQMEVAKTTAKMEKLGVSTADSAAIFQNFNQGLGLTATESIKMQRDLAMAGVDVGISAEKITKDFNASLGTLMVYGRESVNVFKGIAAAAKAAGVETSTLLGIAKQFDTFAGAAEGVGKLNALLGTQLSTTEMLMATEDERIRMLVESVQAQGVAFQDMDRFTQKAIANSVGITDMAEANRIFGMSLKEYDENERKLKASSDAQEKFEKAVSATVPVMNQFKLLGAEIVVTLQPFFEIMNDGAKELTEFFKDLDTETKELIGTFGAFLSGMVLLLPIIKAGGMFVTGFKMVAGVLTSVGTAGTLGGKGIERAGMSAGRAAPGIARLGTSAALLSLEIVGIVGAVAALAGAMGYLYEGVAKVVDSVSGPFMEIFRTMFGTDEEIKEMETRTAEAMSRIVSGKPEVALASIKQMVAEVNKMGATPEVRSTIENLALVTAGQAKDMNGNAIATSTTNVTTKVENVFSGMKMTLVVDGKQIDGYIDGLET